MPARLFLRSTVGRYPRIAVLAVGIVMVSGFRPVLVREVAANRVTVAGRHGAEARRSSSSSFASGSTFSSSVSGNTGTTGGGTTGTTGGGTTGGGGSSGCLSGWSTTSSSCSSYESFNAKSRVAAFTATCTTTDGLGSCPAVDEDVRGDWVYRSTCRASYCEQRTRALSTGSLAARAMRRVWSAGLLAVFAESRLAPPQNSFRCTLEAKDRACVVLDSARNEAAVATR